MDIHTIEWKKYSMVQSPSWEANWFAASQEIPCISWNPKVHYRTHKRPPPEINNNTKFKDQLEVEFVTTSRYMCIYINIPLS